MRDLVVLLGAEVPSGRAVAKKLRSEHFSCKLLASDAPAEAVKAVGARGIVIAGELGEGASAPDPGLLSLGLPLLALGSAARSLLGTLGQSQETLVENTVLPVYYRESRLFDTVDSGERWIQKAEAFDVREPYAPLAEGDGMPVAYGDEETGRYLLQFQIERNDPDGTTILRTFAEAICGCTPWWTPENIVAAAQERIRDTVGDGEAICAMSGGLDSTVAAVLAKGAVGDRVRCVFIDTGLLREGENEETAQYFSNDLGLNFQRVDASERILWALNGLTRMNAKWRVIEREITDALRVAAGCELEHPVFIKGTNYMDTVIGDGKDVHELDGATVVEPLGELFKDEIRDIGLTLGISETVLSRQPFPGVGLAARIRGEVTAERLSTLRRADAIFVDEMNQTGQGKRLSRYFAMLDPQEQGNVIILRALQGTEPSMTVARLPYDLIERTVERISQELPTVCRILYDMTPGMAEWMN